MLEAPCIAVQGVVLHKDYKSNWIFRISSFIRIMFYN